MRLFTTNLFVFLALVAYFDFMPSRFVTLSGATVPIQLHDKLSDTDYYKNLKIRPITKNALVSVFRNNDSAWVSQYALSSQLPDYAQELLIKPVFSGEYFSLSFEILDTKTGKQYRTTEKKIWGLRSARSALLRLITKTAPD